jgi:hypothetical protein
MRLACLGLTTLLIIGCASSTAPRTNDVAFAYARWSGFHPSSYSFDLSTRSAMLSSPGADHITVANGQMVSVLDPSGTRIQFVAFTIDTLWARIRAAQQNGTLNSAEFTLSGVPTDVDMGTWANDGGIHYTIRNFAVVK